MDETCTRWFCAEIKNIPVFADSTKAISLSNSIYHSRIKHTDIGHHFVKDNVRIGDALLEVVITENQVANVVAKLLPIKRFYRIEEILALVTCPINKLSINDTHDSYFYCLYFLIILLYITCSVSLSIKFIYIYLLRYSIVEFEMYLLVPVDRASTLGWPHGPMVDLRIPSPKTFSVDTKRREILIFAKCDTYIQGRIPLTLMLDCNMLISFYSLFAIYYFSCGWGDSFIS